MFTVCTNSHLSWANWPNWGCLFLWIKVQAHDVAQGRSVSSHAHLAVTNRYLVILWPRVLMQQGAQQGRRCEMAWISWEELIIGELGVGNSHSQSNQPFILFSLKAVRSPSHWQMHNGEENPGQFHPTRNQCFVEEVTRKIKEAVCQCKATAFYLNKHKNEAFNVKPLADESKISWIPTKMSYYYY